MKRKNFSTIIFFFFFVIIKNGNEFLKMINKSTHSTKNISLTEIVTLKKLYQ